MVQLALGYNSSRTAPVKSGWKDFASSTTPCAESWSCFSGSYEVGKRFKDFVCKELAQGPALRHGSF